MFPLKLLYSTTLIMLRFLVHKTINLATILTTTSALVISLPIMAKNIRIKPNLEDHDYIFSHATISSALTRQTTLFAQKQDNRKRVALVIGNANYQDQIPLNNPLNDANDIAAKLKEIGFEVILITDGNQRQMDQALDQFYQKLTQGGVGLFYYAGHGMQLDGENYLIPIDANLKSESDIKYQTLALNRVLDKMYDAESAVKIIILDACRDNPYARNWKTRSASETRGLAQLQSKNNAQGEFIAYATQPGNVSWDGKENQRNGIFTSHLLKHLTTPNKTIDEIFNLVRQGVAQETKKFALPQVPFVTTGLIGTFYFNPTVASEDTPQPSSLEEELVTKPSSTPINETTSKPSPQPEEPTDTTSAPVNETISKPSRQPEESTTASPDIISTEVALNSARGVDYTQLRDLLAAGKWEEADLLTEDKILEVANRKKFGWLREKDIENLSCEDLRTMDQLWKKYSNGNFGFSVQKEVYLGLGGGEKYNAQMWRKFADQVGWRKEGQWLWYSDLNFELSNTTKKAHLPCWVRRRGYGWQGIWELTKWKGFSSLVHRVIQCNL